MRSVEFSVIDWIHNGFTYSFLKEQGFNASAQLTVFFCLEVTLLFSMKPHLSYKFFQRSLLMAVMNCSEEIHSSSGRLSLFNGRSPCHVTHWSCLEGFLRKELVSLLLYLKHYAVSCIACCILNKCASFLLYHKLTTIAKLRTQLTALGFTIPIFRLIF